MSNGLFWGCFLIAAGPPFVLYCAVIAQRSFLVLLSLARYVLHLLGQYTQLAVYLHLLHLIAIVSFLFFLLPCSAFYWLLVFLLISAVFRGAHFEAKFIIARLSASLCVRHVHCRPSTLGLHRSFCASGAAISNAAGDRTIWLVAVAQAGTCTHESMCPSRE